MLDRSGQVDAAGAEWPYKAVVMQSSLNLDGLLRGLGGHQQRCDAQSVAGFMEMLQVECEVPCLVQGRGGEVPLADLGPDDEQNLPCDEDHIDASTKGAVLLAGFDESAQAGIPVARHGILLPGIRQPRPAHPGRCGINDRSIDRHAA